MGRIEETGQPPLTILLTSTKWGTDKNICILLSEYLNLSFSYVILQPDENDESFHGARNPRQRPLSGVSFPFWEGGLIPRLATYPLCSTICICSKPLHLPRQRLKTMRVCPRCSPPFSTCLGAVACQLYHRGRNATRSLSPCLLSKP